MDDRRSRPEPGRRLAGFVLTVLQVVAAVALVAGPAYWINGLTQPLVRIDGALAEGIPVSTAPTVPVPGVSVSVPADSPARLVVFDAGNAGDERGAHLRTATKLLWRSYTLVAALSIGAGALFLARLAAAARRGQPFTTRSERWIQLVAGCVLIGGTVPPYLHHLSLERALQDGGLLDHRPLLDGYALDLWPFLAVAGLLVVAQIFRQGARTAQDAEGLV